MSAVFENYGSPLPDTLENSSYLTLKNKVDELNKLSVWINDIAILFEISDNVVFKIDLTLTELMSNIINYAFPDQCESEINIKCFYSYNIIKIDVEDNGIPFNPLALPDVVLPKSLAEAHIGGLGILIIRQYADESSYQRKNNKNIFTIKLKNTNNPGSI
jgi:anti-sigma regulatory factor (Ser/Thr protein kinase)